MFTREVLEAQFKFPFGDSTVRLVEAARTEATRFDHNYIGTEVGNPQLINKFGLKIQSIRNAAEWIIGRGDRPVAGDPGFTPRSKKVINLSIDEARHMIDKSLESDHIMIGLVRKGEGIAAGILEQMGLNLDKARRGVSEIRQDQVEVRKPNSLDLLRNFLSDPNQDLAKQVYLQRILDNLTGLILPPSEQK